MYISSPGSPAGSGSGHAPKAPGTCTAAAEQRMQTTRAAPRQTPPEPPESPGEASQGPASHESPAFHEGTPSHETPVPEEAPSTPPVAAAASAAPDAPIPDDVACTSAAACSSDKSGFGAIAGSLTEGPALEADTCEQPAETPADVDATAALLATIPANVFAAAAAAAAAAVAGPSSGDVQLVSSDPSCPAPRDEDTSRISLPAEPLAAASVPPVAIPRLASEQPERCYLTAVERMGQPVVDMQVQHALAQIASQHCLNRSNFRTMALASDAPVLIRHTPMTFTIRGFKVRWGVSQKLKLGLPCCKHDVSSFAPK